MNTTAKDVSPVTDKRIAYVLKDNGVDGMAPTRIAFAFWSENNRDAFWENSRNKNWLTKDERIVDVVRKRKDTLGKLDGLELLVLGLPVL